MADVDEVPDRRHRKSVAFSDGTTLIDGDGKVTLENGSGDASTVSAADPVDEATASFDDLALKKKKKSSKKKEVEADADEAPAADAGADAGADADAPAVDAEFDPLALKKKKKKKAPKEDVDFDSKLAEAGAVDKAGDDAADVEAASAPGLDADAAAGDMDEGTGIWSHDAVGALPYDALLARFFKLLNAHNPDLMSGMRSHKIPPPQCLREGNKKTIFANIPEICKRMKRSEEHVTQFLFAELGTTGSTDGSRRLVIKGKFMQKQIENVLRRYISEYVTCKTCRSPDTELVRGENRLYFINCNSCGSRRSVVSIKTGFTAQVGKRKRQQG